MKLLRFEFTFFLPNKITKLVENALVFILRSKYNATFIKVGGFSEHMFRKKMNSPPPGRGFIFKIFFPKKKPSEWSKENFFENFFEKFFEWIIILINQLKIILSIFHSSLTLKTFLCLSSWVILINQ